MSLPLLGERAETSQSRTTQYLLKVNFRRDILLRCLKDIEEGGPGLEEPDEEEEFPLLTKEKKADVKKFEGMLSKQSDTHSMVLI